MDMERMHAKRDEARADAARARSEAARDVAVAMGKRDRSRADEVSEDGGAENVDQVEGGPVQGEARQTKARRRGKHKRRGARKRVVPCLEEGRTSALPAPPKPTPKPAPALPRISRAHLHLPSPSALMAVGLLTGLLLCWRCWTGVVAAVVVRFGKAGPVVVGGLLLAVLAVLIWRLSGIRFEPVLTRYGHDPHIKRR